MKIINWKKNKIIILALFFATYTFGQTSNVKLKIGDTAPELRVIWIKGNPFKEFNKDQLYVLEFWATWCTPCKAAMPHLSELARKYTNKITFIGVDVWENNNAGKEAYEKVLPSVKNFVVNMGDKMDYNVVMDNNERYMGNQWMKASGQRGIPATFLIKEGKIIWIGHPMKLDKVLEDVLSDNYNMAGFAEEFYEADRKMREKWAPLEALTKQVDEAMINKNHSEALKAIDNGITSIDPTLKSAVYNLKLTTLFRFDVPQALKFAKKWKAESPSAGLTIGSIIAAKEALPHDAYKFGVSIFEEFLDDNRSTNPAIYHLLAQCYFKMNDFSKAITIEEKAIKLAKRAISEGEQQGLVNKNSILEYEETLAKYKAAKK